MNRSNLVVMFQYTVRLRIHIVLFAKYLNRFGHFQKMRHYQELITWSILPRDKTGMCIQIANEVEYFTFGEIIFNSPSP